MNSKLTFSPLKQVIIRENRLSLSKVMTNLVKACKAGNAKNMRNWSTLPRDFSATARTKKSRVVRKLVLRHVHSGNIQLVAFSGVSTNHGPNFFDLSPILFEHK
jgi:hypothetical protein